MELKPISASDCWGSRSSYTCLLPRAPPPHTHSSVLEMGPSEVQGEAVSTVMLHSWLQATCTCLQPGLSPSRGLCHLRCRAWVVKELETYGARASVTGFLPLQRRLFGSEQELCGADVLALVMWCWRHTWGSMQCRGSTLGPSACRMCSSMLS